MDRLIKGKIFTGISDKVFRIFEIAMRIVTLVLKVVNKLVNHYIASKLDVVLQRIGRRMVVNSTQVSDNTILFVTDQGEYTCNPKYIAEEIMRRKLPYEVTWVLRGKALGPYPQGFNLVKDGSPDYFRAVAGAKVVVENGHSLQRNGVYKNKGQVWIQTWHGSLGLKKLEGAGGDQNFYRRMQKLDQEQTDYVITNSQFEDNVFNSTYWTGVPSLRLGHARNDILFEESKERLQYLRKKVLKRLNIEDRGQKFLLFAPTHNDKVSDRSYGNLDFDALVETLEEKFGGTWDILIRTHNSNKGKSNKWLAGLPMYCYNASFYPDMQELLILADVGLTDYSSWICDYILTRKPSFLYGANIDMFKQTRGFYHKFEDTPFSIATSNKQLIDNITEFKQKEYERKIDKFLNDCECIDDGNAAKRIVDKIEELMLS